MLGSVLTIDIATKRIKIAVPVAIDIGYCAVPVVDLDATDGITVSPLVKPYLFVKPHL